MTKPVTTPERAEGGARDESLKLRSLRDPPHQLPLQLHPPRLASPKKWVAKEAAVDLQQVDEGKRPRGRMHLLQTVRFLPLPKRRQRLSVLWWRSTVRRWRAWRGCSQPPRSIRVPLSCSSLPSRKFRWKGRNPLPPATTACPSWNALARLFRMLLILSWLSGRDTLGSRIFQVDGQNRQFTECSFMYRNWLLIWSNSAISPIPALQNHSTVSIYFFHALIRAAQYVQTFVTHWDCEILI